MEHGRPFEDVFPIEHGEYCYVCLPEGIPFLPNPVTKLLSRPQKMRRLNSKQNAKKLFVKQPKVPKASQSFSWRKVGKGSRQNGPCLATKMPCPTLRVQKVLKNPTSESKHPLELVDFCRETGDFMVPT